MKCSSPLFPCMWYHHWIQSYFTEILKHHTEVLKHETGVLTPNYIQISVVNYNFDQKPKNSNFITCIRLQQPLVNYSFYQKPINSTFLTCIRLQQPVVEYKSHQNPEISFSCIISWQSSQEFAILRTLNTTKSWGVHHTQNINIKQ